MAKSYSPFFQNLGARMHYEEKACTIIAKRCNEEL